MIYFVFLFSIGPQRNLTNRDNYGRGSARLPIFFSINVPLMCFFLFLTHGRLQHSDDLRVRFNFNPSADAFSPIVLLILRRNAEV